MKFRAQVSKSGGQLPRDEILGFLVDSESEALELMAELAPGDVMTGRLLAELWTRVMPRAQRLCQRRGRVDPALQSLAVSSAAPLVASTEATHTLAWLKSQSGACRHFRGWSARQRRKALSTDPTASREAFETAELQRWRASLAELVIEAGLPVSYHAQLTSIPEAIIVASLGNMRASTIRKRSGNGANCAIFLYNCAVTLGPRIWVLCWIIYTNAWRNLVHGLCRRLCLQHWRSWKRLGA